MAPTHQPFVMSRIADHITLMNSLLEDATYLAAVSGAGAAMADALRAGHKVLFFGNGGSAAVGSPGTELEFAL